MPEYRVTAGTHRTSDGDRAEPGDTIELSESEAAQFQNKLELVESDANDEGEPESDNETSTALDEEADGDSNGTPEGASDSDIGGVEAAGNVPEDYALLSKMAKHYDGDDIHGAMSGDEISGFLETLSDTEVAALKQQSREEISDEQ